MQKMKRNYEGVIVLDTTGRENDVDQLVQEVGREIEAEGGSLEQIEQIGHKDFAYNARKLAGGHYVSYHFEAEPNVIDKMKARLKLNAAVHIQHYQVR